LAQQLASTRQIYYTRAMDRLAGGTPDQILSAEPSPYRNVDANDLKTRVEALANVSSGKTVKL
jgi:hypothetical protein